jgi:cell division topological specificity factor
MLRNIARFLSLTRFLSRQEKSSETARKRLRMVLVLDRVGMAPEYLSSLKDEIVQVVSRYLVIDEEAIEIEVRRMVDSVVLVSNIPVKDMVRASPVAN